MLLLDEPVDEYCFNHLHEYEKKKLVNVEKENVKLADDDEVSKKTLKKLKKYYKPLTEWWQKILGMSIQSVTVSQRLVDDPVICVSPEHANSANMERIQKSQTLGRKDPNAHLQNARRILEINPSHPAIKLLLEKVKDEEIPVE